MELAKYLKKRPEAGYYTASTLDECDIREYFETEKPLCPFQFAQPARELVQNYTVVYVDDELQSILLVTEDS